MKITSTSFEDGGMIPRKYACDGEDISPPLAWTEIPDSTKTLALICEDPDAPVGTWVHWVIFNIPASERALHEHIPSINRLPNGAIQGRNDFGNIGYGGPCPPMGTHRYFFRIYALSTVLNLEPGISKSELLNAMEDVLLAEGQLMGRYNR